MATLLGTPSWSLLLIFSSPSVNAGDPPELSSLLISICTHNLEHLPQSQGLKNLVLLTVLQEADAKMGLYVQEIHMLL